MNESNLTTPNSFIAFLFNHKFKVVVSVLILIASSTYYAFVSPLNTKYQSYLLADPIFQEQLGDYYSPLYPTFDKIGSSSKNGVFSYLLNQAMRAFELKDYSRAFFLLYIPVIFNNTDAEYLTATLYANGFGVKQNFAKAEQYLQRASISEHAPSQFLLCCLLNHGLDIPGLENSLKSKIQNARNSYLHRSALNGFDKAQYALGVFYEAGMFGKVNIDEALKWYKAAAIQGNEDAIEANSRITAYLYAIEREKQNQLAVEQQRLWAAYENQQMSMRAAEKKAARGRLIRNTALVLLGAGAITGAALSSRRRHR